MDDSKIVDLYLLRDEEAIRKTAEKYGSRLRALAHGIVCDRQAAEERISKLLDKFCDGKARDNDLINVKYSLLFMDKAYPEVCKAYLLKTEFRNNAIKESTLIDSYFKLLDKYGLLIKLGYLPYGG